jgi:hypothetical protein
MRCGVTVASILESFGDGRAPLGLLANKVREIYSNVIAYFKAEFAPAALLP